jgi:NAD(P)-dependent dehydrogenase (short-subunit alcohol dehydrogenase family)
MSSQLQERHVFITGASRGIGAAIAALMAQSGARLSLIGRSQEPLERLVKELPQTGAYQIFACDVSNHEAIHQMVERAIDGFGPIEILVNNAGQAESASIEQTSLSLWQKMLDINLTGTYNCIHAALPSLRACARADRPSKIINVASTAGLQGYPQVSAYTAAKHGVVGLTRALALELARHHVSVNAICPGYTETDIARQAIESLTQKKGKTTEEAYLMLAKRNPQQRLIQPEEIAQAVLWLCHPQSVSVNGQAIVIDGGELAG